MADSISDGTPKEAEDSQKTEEIPASPHVNTSKEPTMEDLTDSEAADFHQYKSFDKNTVTSPEVKNQSTAYKEDAF